MKLYQYVKKELILTDLKARNKAEALRRMTSAFKETGLIHNEKGLYQNIMAREKVMTTAMGKGLAVPHGFSKEIQDMAIGVAILAKALDFQSLDQQPVKVIFMIVVNEERADLNLKALAGISRMARHSPLSQRLESAVDPTAVLSIIRETEGQITHH